MMFKKSSFVYVVSSALASIISVSAVDVVASETMNTNLRRRLGGGQPDMECPAASPLDGDSNKCHTKKLEGTTCQYRFITFPTFVDGNNCDPNETVGDMTCSPTEFCHCEDGSWLCATYGIAPCAEGTEPKGAYTSCSL